MALRTYVKEKNTVVRRVGSIVSYITLTLGAMLLFWAFYPIISFELYSRLFLQNGYTSPVPGAAPILAYSSSDGSNSFMFANNVRDFTQASLWFPSAKDVFISNAKDELLDELDEISISDVKSYALSIPKLSIKDANVEVGGDDLSRHLIHYLPHTLPGKKGNVVIFGHSTLPQLYNIKDYKTIFTYLPSLNKGDRVQLKMGDTSYEYEIFDMFVVKPDQISVLDQKYDDSYLTLITCVPPGTYWNRLVVKAKLTNIPSTLSSDTMPARGF